MSRRLSIAFTSPFHHGSGFGFGGLIDRTCLRRSDGLPYLAGSAIKGRLRHSALRLLGALGEPFCGEGIGPPCRGEPCALCRVFGSVRRPSPLVIADGVLAAPWREILAEIVDSESGRRPGRLSELRMNIALDRTSRTTRQGALFCSELMPENLAFDAEILGDLEDPEDWRTLEDAADLITHFGGGASRGWGRCRVKLVEEERHDSVHR